MAVGGVFGSAAVCAQDYHEAVITFVTGEVDTALVLDEAPGDLARAITVRGPSETDTIHEARSIARLESDALGHFRQVRRPYDSFTGTEVDAFRLARRLIEGPVSLYRLDLRTAEKSVIRQVGRYGVQTYYLEAADGDLYELPQQEEQSATDYRLRRDYVGRLSYHLQSCEELRTRLRTEPPKYNDGELGTVFRLYGRCTGEPVTETPPPRSRLRFDGLYLGTGFTSFASPTPLTAPPYFVGVRAGLRLPGTFPAASLELGFNLTTVEREIRTARQRDLLPGASVLVRIEGDVTKPVRPYVGAGLSVLLDPERGGVGGLFPVLMQGEAGASLHRFRLGLRISPVGLTVQESNPGPDRGGSLTRPRILLLLGASVGIRIAGPPPPRRRVWAGA